MENTIKILVASAYDEECKRILDVLSKQNDICIVGVEKDESGTIIKSARLKPDVLILNLQSSGISGDKLAPIIHRRSPSTAIIMLCDNDEDIYAGLALKAGISGFLLKGTDMDKLVPVVKIVFFGGYYISASITVRVFTAVTFMHCFPATQSIPLAQITEYQTGHFILSPAELGIVTDIAEGFSDAQIAKHLNFSAGTIRNYVISMKRKTKLKSRVQIVIYSLIYGLIRFDQLRFVKNNRHNFNDTIQ